MKKIFNLYNISLILIVALIGMLTLRTTEVKATGTVNWPSGSTVTLSRTVQNVYNAPEVDFTYSISTEDTSLLKTADFDTGENINAKMKNLANNSSSKTYSSDDTTIQAIKRGNNLPGGFTPTAANTLSLATSANPIYIWWDSTTHTIYYYTEADVIYLNPESYYLFYKFKSLNDISGLSYFNTSKVTYMTFIFYYCSSLSNIDAIANWDLSAALYTSSMFQYCTHITNVDALANWNTSSVQLMGSMFSDCTILRNISALSNWDTSNVTNMKSMFSACTGLSNIDALAKWDTSSVTNMANMFQQSGIKDIDALANWNMSSVNNTQQMFYECSSLADIDGASNWDTSAITNISYMFYHCFHATGTVQVLCNPTAYSGVFNSAATQSGAQITVNYSNSVTKIDNIIATKSAGEYEGNVVKGSVVSVPSSSGGNSQGGTSNNSSSGTVFNHKTLSFDGSETVSNNYTVSKSGTIDLSNIGLNFTKPGNYELTVKETGTNNSAYPIDDDNEYTIIIQVTNVTNQDGTPTGNFNANFVIKDDNDTKVNSMAFSEAKDETKFGYIEVSKTVKGIMADRTENFEFSVQVDDAASSACTNYSGSEKYLISGSGVTENGSEVTKCKSGTKDTIHLTHGQSATIGRFTYNNNNYNSISIDDYYKITETLKSGYTTSFKVGSGSETSSNEMSPTQISNGANSVVFYNQKEGSPVTGIILTILPYLLLIGIGTGGLILFKKKKEKEV